MLGSSPWQKLRKRYFPFDGNKALGPNGFSFFQKFWTIVENDLKVLLKDFYHDRLNIDRLNYAFIELILKKNRKMTVKDFRPISLLNSLYKIITKILSWRLAKFFPDLVIQLTFIKGRSSVDYFLSTLEMLAYCKRSGKKRKCFVS